jgi:hypothetical protein
LSLNLDSHFKPSIFNRKRSYVLNRSSGHQAGTFPSEPTDNGVAHIDRSVAGWKNLARLFNFGRYPLKLHLSNNILRGQSTENRQKNTSIFPKGFGNFPAIAVVSDVATRSTRHQYFDTSFVVLF